MATCPSCLTEVTPLSNFCSRCGAALVAAEPDATETASVNASPGSESSSIDRNHGRFLPGAKISERYRIVSMLGRGGMGEVYRADDLKLGHSVALKFLPERMASDQRRLELFLNEVRLSRQISHPNVCRVFDIGEVGQLRFLSMEYIDGEDLRQLLRRIGRLSPDKGIELTQQLCAGLAAAHDVGVLHRDLKPANVMIDGQGQVRITDFGLAKPIADTESAEVVGTPAYMAPEQLADGKTSIQSDLYSLGLILFESFTGEAAHESITTFEQESQSTRPSQLVPELDSAVDRVIMRCLEFDPNMRPQSAHAIATALPGGDPLAAALAAGETPSPQLVASAGTKFGLKWQLALGLLLLIPVMIFGIYL